MVSSPFAYGTSGVPFSFFVVFEPGPIIWYAFDTGALPAGLTADSVTGEIYGTTAESGFFPVFLTGENDCASSGDYVYIEITGGGGGSSSSGGGY